MELVHSRALLENAELDSFTATLDAAYAEHSERKRNLAAQLKLFDRECA